MSKLETLKNYHLIVVPNLSTNIALFRKKLFKNNGAKVNYRFPRTLLDKTFIIIEDGNSSVGIDTLCSSLGISVGKHDLLVVRYPILKKEWVIDSLLASTSKEIRDYLYHIERVSVDTSLDANFKVKTLNLSDSDREEKPAKLRKLDSALKRESQELESSENANQRVIDLFSQLASEYKKNGQSFKYVNYRKAIDSISKLDHPVTTFEEAITIPHVGKRLAEKIVQISKTGELRQLDEIKKDPKLLILQSFTRIHGVGQTIAAEWYEKGLRTVEEVSNLPNLTEQQRLGIEFYTDWNTKIPRLEVESHIEFIHSTLIEIDPKLDIICTGSYRRGSSECGDIDFLLLKQNCNDRTEMSSLLFSLINNLKEKGYIKCSLTHIKPRMRKFYGGGQLKGYSLCRRVDILSIPWAQKGSQLLYFTGNDILNRSMRQLAGDMGMHLSDQGLFANYKKEDQKLLASFDEKQIFDKLGLDYKEPQERNIGNISYKEFIQTTSGQK